jgi:Hypothetical protein (DUF2513)
VVFHILNGGVARMQLVEKAADYHAFEGVLRETREQSPQQLEIEGYAADQISYHAFLLMEAGLVAGADVTTTGSSGPAARIIRLTWSGHEFADAARDEPRWQSAMGVVKEKCGSITMDVLKDLFLTLMRSAIGLP